MKLIMEGASLLTGSYEDEMNESTGNTERNYYISGTFSTPEAKNRNGRVYSRAIWEREVQKYQKEINERSVNTLGEWQHPPRSTVDPLKAVMRIVELKLDETGNVVGRAKILNDNTEQTNKIKGLIKEGIKIGVSSRGVGKVSSTGVVEDFKLITYDAVDMPSDYNAMLDGVVEGVQFLNGIAQDKEYKIDENGCIGEACSLASTQVAEAKENGEPCPIQEKITEAVAEAKQEIIDGMAEYMSETLSSIAEKINSNEEILIENISAYIDSKNNAIIENISAYLENPKQDEIVTETIIVEDTKLGEDTAKSIIKALKEAKEAKEIQKAKEVIAKDEESSKCKECGKDIKDGEKLCSSCEDKNEEKVTEKTVDNLVRMGILSKKEFEEAMSFVDKVDSYDDFQDAFPKMKAAAMTVFKDLF